MITLLATGTRGDTQPYIALGMALKKTGKAVRVAAFENYAEYVKSFGLEFYPIPGDVSIIANSDQMHQARGADNPLKLFLSFNKLKSLAAGLHKDFFNACIGSEAIVYHPGAAIGYFAAQHLKIPSILATPFPMTPTREYPSIIFYDKARLGKTYNLLTHLIMEQIMWFASNSSIKEFWKKEFGDLPENFGSPFGRQITRSLPTIVSCSNYVFPRPSDWPEHIYNTGYWFIEKEVGWTPPQDLLVFLGKGKPPVYVGFGSVGDPSTAIETTRLVIAALQRAGQRGILATGWSGMERIENIPEEIYILDSAPHSWLFPKMAAVIHHGGAGTTAAGLNAGVPGIIIPHGNDQFAWGRRIYELGVGSKPIPRKKLTIDKLSEAINFVMRQPVIDAANDLGMKIQGENGAEDAANIILKCLTPC